MNLILHVMPLQFATGLLGFLLLLISWIDYWKMIIPNVLNLALAMSGIFISVNFLNCTLLSILFQGACAFILFLTFGQLYFQSRNVSGLGGGDIKFLSAATCWVGLWGLPWTVLIASFSGLTWALISHFGGRRMVAKQRLAFGPHLSLGLLITWMMRDAVFNFPA
jgi:leader peptidase (prepilin peptidase) / N-methyltransferase